MPQAREPADLETVVLWDRGRLHRRSDAVLAVLRLLGGGWVALGGVGWCVPLPVRDAAYRFVARRRLAMFGKADACRAPSARERDRFLP